MNPTVTAIIQNTQKILNLEKVFFHKELYIRRVLTFAGFTELNSSEESGKDWSDLEAEAAAADKEDAYVRFLQRLMSIC